MADTYCRTGIVFFDSNNGPDVDNKYIGSFFRGMQENLNYFQMTTRLTILKKYIT